jgi:hypothetical protein
MTYRFECAPNQSLHPTASPRCARLAAGELRRWAVHLGAEAVAVLLRGFGAYALSQFDGRAMHRPSAARASKGTAAHSRSMARAISAAVGGATAASIASAHTPRCRRGQVLRWRVRAACAGVKVVLRTSRPARAARRGRFKQGHGAWPPHRTCCVWVGEHSRGSGASHHQHRAMRASLAGWRVAGWSGAVRNWPAGPTRLPADASPHAAHSIHRLDAARAAEAQRWLARSGPVR